MNDLQLFKMYRELSFRRRTALMNRIRRGPLYKRSNMGIAVDNDEYARDWQKWNDLIQITRKELERRLAPPAAGSLQHFNDAVSYWAQPTIYVVPKKERGQ